MKRKNKIIILIAVAVCIAIAVCGTAIGLTVGKKHTHSYTESVTLPTCTEQGYTTHTCECGDSFKDNYINAQHTPANAIRENEVDSTCKTEGSYDEVVKCSVCSTELSRTPKTIEKKPHTEVIDPAVEATLTSTGLTEGKHCSICGEVLIEQQVTQYENVYIKSANGYKIDLSGKIPTLYKEIDNDVTTYDLSDDFVISSPKSKWGLYSDIECVTYLSRTKIMSNLKIGKNVAYIGVESTESENNFTCYEVTIYRLDIKDFDFKDGTSTYLNGTIQEHDKLNKPQSPVKNGYTFAYWADESGKEATFPYFITKDTTFNAVYTINTYDIIYKLNGGLMTTDKNSYNVETAVTFDTPTRAGGTFMGWYENQDFNGNSIDGIAVGNYGDKTVYAKWNLITYSISYELNGGSLTTDKNSYNVETAVTFDIPAKTCYTFNGWYDNQDFSGEAITELATGNYGNKRYYAKWSPTVYKIIYELNGGLLTTDKNSYNIETAVTFDTPTKAGGTFMGWYESQDFSGNSVDGIAVGNYGDKTVYAKWEMATYSIAYNLLDGGTSTEVLPQNYNIETPTFKIPKLLKNEYYFDGWYTETEFVNKVSQIEKGSYGDLTLYAKWLQGTSELKYHETNSSCTVESISSDISEVVIPSLHNNKPVITIGNWAFRECSNLTSITIPDGVTTIGEYAFYYCSSLTSITIPDNVTTIGESTFYGCSSLTSIKIPDGITIIDNSVFSECSSLTSITIPDSVTTISDSAFSNCSSLTSITIPDSVTTIGKCAFRYCFKLTIITLSQNLTTIGLGVFDYCNSLTSITIPDSLTTISHTAFSNCSSLTNITIPDSVTTIGAGAFSGCSSLTSITIPDNVTTIGESTFYGCSSLTSIKIPDGITIIDNSVFSECSSLTSITIGNGVTTIGNSAFSRCSILTSVYYKGTMEEWENISISSDNTYLTNANRYYYSKTEPELNEDGTAYDGNYWHYVDDEVVVWIKEN